MKSHRRSSRPRPRKPETGRSAQPIRLPLGSRIPGPAPAGLYSGRPAEFSRFIFGESLGDLPARLEGSSPVIVTDRNVYRLYGGHMPERALIIVLPSGEERKNLGTIEFLYRRFFELGLDRSSFVAGIGGGVVCDITGFAASTFMRGLRFGFVPTTLLSQVDAAVGGKNGVNFLGVKNMIGLIRQPAFVLFDHSLLATLPRKERLNGFSEIIKSAAIADPSLFEFLEEEHRRLLALEEDVVSAAIRSSVRIKKAFVERDEGDDDERKKLNFGHTLGHALEAAYGLSHGRAVSIGMAFAGRVSYRKKMIGREDLERLERALTFYHLPVEFPFDRRLVMDKIRKDKKKREGAVDFVLLKAIGRARLEKIELDELEEHIRDLY